MIKKHGSGILLHLTSLPSPFGIGDLGPAAYGFVDFLKETKQSFWQVLPLNPTDLAFGSSPYSSHSAYAGNILLISPELLQKAGWLAEAELANIISFPEERVDFEAVVQFKLKLLNLAFAKFLSSGQQQKELAGFCQQNDYWLDNFALFAVLKEKFGGQTWNLWDQPIRDRQAAALGELKERFKQEILREKFFQYLFYQQWHELRNYANRQGISLIGDIPFYVSYDSADVWEHNQIFKLDENKLPTHVAGVPPDFFSRTGQLWGSPVYRWDILRQQGFAWWEQRLEHNFSLFDIVRLDHFRGFVSFWEVPAGETTAINGHWAVVPVDDFLTKLVARFQELPVIAEDLGVITDDVKAVMQKFALPGMKVLLFAFSENLDTHPYLPHNYPIECVVYTGTHDNNTVKGWFKNEATALEKRLLAEYLGQEVSEETVNWQLIELAFKSLANVTIIPLQDVLGLGQAARMNLPASSGGNWQWRFTASQLTPEVRSRLLQLTMATGRG